MKKRGYRPCKTPPKDRRTMEERLDEWEAIDTSDWRRDCEEREWKQSEDHAKRKQLADSFAKRKSS